MNKNTDNDVELTTYEKIIESAANIIGDLLLCFIILGVLYNISIWIIGVNGQIPLEILFLYPLAGIIGCVFFSAAVEYKREKLKRENRRGGF